MTVNHLLELKKIAASQKTISTSRLNKYLVEIERMYIQQAKKIKSQRERNQKLNERYVKERGKH